MWLISINQIQEGNVPSEDHLKIQPWGNSTELDQTYARVMVKSSEKTTF